MNYRRLFEAAALLPARSYAAIPGTFEVVLLTKGMPGYAGVVKNCSSREEAEKAATVANQEVGVTARQAEAMFAGSMFGWDRPSADPRIYSIDGRPDPEKLAELYPQPETPSVRPSLEGQDPDRLPDSGCYLVTLPGDEEAEEPPHYLVTPENMSWQTAMNQVDEAVHGAEQRIPGPTGRILAAVIVALRRRGFTEITPAVWTADVG